jgi:hypothetical protein
VYEKCVESNPEFEVIGDIQVPLPKAPKNSFTPKPNHLCNKFDTTQDPPKFPPKTNDFQKLVRFVSEKGEKPRKKPEPKPKPIPFRCQYCGKERHIVEFCYKRKRDEGLLRSKQTRTGIASLMVFLSLECHFHGVWEVREVLAGSHREAVVRGLRGEMMVCVLVRGLVGLVVVLLDVPYSSSIRV